MGDVAILIMDLAGFRMINKSKPTAKRVNQ